MAFLTAATSGSGASAPMSKDRMTESGGAARIRLGARIHHSQRSNPRAGLEGKTNAKNKRLKILWPLRRYLDCKGS